MAAQNQQRLIGDFFRKSGVLSGVLSGGTSPVSSSPSSPTEPAEPAAAAAAPAAKKAKTAKPKLAPQEYEPWIAVDDQALEAALSAVPGTAIDVLPTVKIPVVHQQFHELLPNGRPRRSLLSIEARFHHLLNHRALVQNATPTTIPAGAIVPGTEGQRRPNILHEGITYTFTEHVYTRRQQTQVDRGTRTRTFHVAPPIPLLVGNARYEGDTERGGFDARSKTVVGAALQSSTLESTTQRLLNDYSTTRLRNRPRAPSSLLNSSASFGKWASGITTMPAPNVLVAAWRRRARSASVHGVITPAAARRFGPPGSK